MREYFYSNDPLPMEEQGDQIVYTLSETIVEYKGGNILVVEKRHFFEDTGIDLTVIPGRVVETKTNEGGYKTSQVLPIRTKEDQAGIEKIVREEGFEGSIVFW